MFFMFLFWNLFLLVVEVAAVIPNDWQSRVDTFNAFYSEDDTMRINAEGYPQIYLPLIGNGYISHSKGVRSDTMFVSGLFNGETTSPSHRARIPATFAITVSNEDTTSGALLDIELGIYYRRGELSNCSYQLSWYAHRSLMNLYVMELSATLANGATFCNIELVNNSGNSSADIEFIDMNRMDGNIGLCGNTTIPEDSSSSVQEVCVVYTPVPDVFVVTPENSGIVHTYITVIRTSMDALSPMSNSVYDAACVDLFDGLIHSRTNLTSDTSNVSNRLTQLHVDEWANLWQHSISIVNGRDDLASAVNASLFAILSSVRSDWPYGLAPGGLTNYYNGHSFWDTETWMYPPMLLLHPTLAKSLIQYRFNRLGGAYKKASSYEPPYSGAMFPWESAYSGVETCPEWAATGIREQHISPDIVFATWQYYLVSKDMIWLKEVGNDIIQGVATFLLSRITLETDGSPNATIAAHFNDIIPPDEYVDHVNDSVYTNYVSSQALAIAAEVASLLNLTAEYPVDAYLTTSAALVVLYDAEKEIHPEYDGYEIVEGNIVKQGDVVLLHYPLGMEMSSTTQKNDLDFYSKVTDANGPAMTWGMHAIGYLDCSEYSTASKYLNMSFQDNMQEPFLVWTETPDGNAGNFITGAGGFLQTVIAGYGGLRLIPSGGGSVISRENNKLYFSPICVEGTTGMVLRGLSYLDNDFDLTYECKNNETPDFPSRIAMKIVKKGRTEIAMVCETCDDPSPMTLEVGIELEICVSSISPSKICIIAV